MELEIGKTYEYIKGDKLLFFKVVKIDNDKAFVEGVTKDYWVKLTTLIKYLEPSMIRRANGLD